VWQRMSCRSNVAAVIEVEQQLFTGAKYQPVCKLLAIQTTEGKMNRLTKAAAYALFGATLFAYGNVFAQAYPSKPVHWIVCFAAGGGNDILTRAIAPTLSRHLGQPVIVENRAAGAGIVAAETVARAVPDGYTIMTCGNSALMFNKLIYPKLSYDPERDFAPITLIANSPIALFVHDSVPSKSVKDFISYTKAQAGKLNYGSAGVGHAFHLAMELLKHRTGMEIMHVPYKGSGQVIPDLVAGRLHAILYNPSEQMRSQVKAGKLRVLAVATPQRLAVLPDTPTFEEAGVSDYDAAGWIAVVAPAGTPRQIVMRLNRDIGESVGSPDVNKIFERESLLPATGTPEQLGERIKREIATFGPVVKALGIALE
jgi:tripartite-type tricarboxylate transporter receptor subunit TctC